MAELDFEVTDEVDITDKVCPLTFVKAKVAIEELEDGEILAVRMNDGEPVQNVPRSMKEEGRFPYDQREAAEEKIELLRQKSKKMYFIQPFVPRNSSASVKGET